MLLEPITCNNCGAALDIPASANFVTCTSCGSRLAVKSNASVVYTEVLQQLDARTQKISADVRQLQLKSDLERIDREWEQASTPYLLRNQDGSISEPSSLLVIVYIVIALVGIGLLAFIVFNLTGVYTVAIVPLFLLGLVLILLTGLAVQRALRTVTAYQRAKAAYLARRAVVQQALEQ